MTSDGFVPMPGLYRLGLVGGGFMDCRVIGDRGGAYGNALIAEGGTEIRVGSLATVTDPTGDVFAVEGNGFDGLRRLDESEVLERTLAHRFADPIGRPYGWQDEDGEYAVEAESASSSDDEAFVDGAVDESELVVVPLGLDIALESIGEGQAGITDGDGPAAASEPVATEEAKSSRSRSRAK